MRKLEVGEKYLTIYILGGQIKLVAFKNVDKKNPKEPDFKSNDCAVWISEKKLAKENIGSTETPKNLI